MLSRRSVFKSIFLAATLSATMFGAAPALAKDSLVATNGQGAKMAVDVYGSGSVAVILAHQLHGSRNEWKSFARTLEKNGYAAYTFDFNGYGKYSGTQLRGENHKDVLQMVALAKSRGAQRVYLVGSSMGASAVLKAGLSAKVDGIVAMAPYVDEQASFSSPSSSEAKRIRKETLLFAAERDSSHPHAQKLDVLMPDATFHSYSGDAHGMELLKGRTSKEVTALLLAFLQ